MKIKIIFCLLLLNCYLIRAQETIQLAAEVAENKGRASSKTIDAFFENGYTNENLVDLILQVSEKTAMNFLHNLTQIPVDFPLAPALD